MTADNVTQMVTPEPEPFDLDALAAEAAGKEPFRFRFGGQDYVLPADMNILAAAAFTHGDIYEGLELLLGVEQWDQMLNSEAVLTDAMLSGLFDKYQSHMGIDVGESSASTVSSKSTVRPSKRTSSGVTRRR